MSPNRLRRFEVRRGPLADGDVVAIGVEFVIRDEPGPAVALDVATAAPLPVTFARSTDILFMHDGCAISWLDDSAEQMPTGQAFLDRYARPNLMSPGD